jgi:tetratricopeptide (TPR) repeat protein
MKKYLIITLSFFFFFSCAKQTTMIEGEIPITTLSDEARQIFIQGREKLDNLKSYEAADLFDEAIQKDPDFARAYLYRSFSGGGYQIYRDNLAKAVALVNKVSEGEKHEIFYLLAGADGEGEKEKSELDQLLSMFPNDKRVLEYAGNYYYLIAQEYDKALEQYKKCSELDPDYPPVYNSTGYLYIDMGNYAEAEKAFKNYIKLIPDEPNPYDSYAEFLLRQGRFDESITQYEKAIGTDSTFSMAYAGTGDNYIFKRDFYKARKYYQLYFDNAMNFNQQMGALLLKATSYVHEGNIDNAIKTWEERAALGHTKKSPNYVISSYNMAVFTLDEVEKFDEGKAYLDKVIEYINTTEMHEADRKTNQYYAGLYRCYHGIMTEDLKSAEKEAAECQLLADTRKNPVEIQTLHLFLGMLEIKKKNYVQAITHFSQADLESPYNWFRMAEAYEKGGKKDKANKLYLRVAESHDNGMGLATIQQRAKKKVKAM